MGVCQWLTFLKPILFEKLNISYCGDLDVNAPTGFCIWIPGTSVGGAIRGGLGGVALTEQACLWRWTSIALGPTLLLVLLWACSWDVSSQLLPEAAMLAAKLSLTLWALTFLNNQLKQTYSSISCFGPGDLSQ